MAVEWIGAVPEVCEICGRSIKDVFYDVKTAQGCWACMCPACFYRLSAGKLGLGSGQRYERQETKWIKASS